MNNKLSLTISRYKDFTQIQLVNSTNILLFGGFDNITSILVHAFAANCCECFYATVAHKHSKVNQINQNFQVQVAFNDLSGPSWRTRNESNHLFS